MKLGTFSWGKGGRSGCGILYVVDTPTGIDGNFGFGRLGSFGCGKLGRLGNLGLGRLGRLGNLGLGRLGSF